MASCMTFPLQKWTRSHWCSFHGWDLVIFSTLCILRMTSITSWVDVHLWNKLGQFLKICPGFKKICPGFQLFQQIDRGEKKIQQCVPLYVHGDEGTWFKKGGILILSFQSPLGYGTSKRDYDMSMNLKNLGESGLPLNFLKAGMYTRMLMLVCPKDWHLQKQTCFFCYVEVSGMSPRLIELSPCLAFNKKMANFKGEVFKMSKLTLQYNHCIGFGLYCFPCWHSTYLEHIYIYTFICTTLWLAHLAFFAVFFEITLEGNVSGRSPCLACNFWACSSRVCTPWNRGFRPWFWWKVVSNYHWQQRGLVLSCSLICC